MEPAYLLPELRDLSKHVESLMSKIRADKEYRTEPGNSVWWNLSSALGSIDNAVGRVLRYGSKGEE